MQQTTGFAHIVFFTLADPTPENVESLTQGCHRHLSGHDGCTYFSVGQLAEEMNRDVNDREFHVALHLAFDSAASHDAYQVHDRHQAFIEENKNLWARVRVFDSHLTSS